MAESEFSREEMIEPIQRMFERESGSDFGLFEPVDDENTKGGSGKIDLVYVEGSVALVHAVRLEETYDGCLFDTTRGIHSLHVVEANYRWIAVPLGEFRSGEDLFNDVMIETCKERGYGIITVQTKGRGVSAKVILEAEKQEGDFVELYGPVNERWEEEVADELVDYRYKVVDYYTRQAQG